MEVKVTEVVVEDIVVVVVVVRDISGRTMRCIVKFRSTVLSKLSVVGDVPTVTGTSLVSIMLVEATEELKNFEVIESMLVEAVLEAFAFVQYLVVDSERIFGALVMGIRNLVDARWSLDSESVITFCFWIISHSIVYFVWKLLVSFLQFCQKMVVLSVP